ncbi:methylated-DNA--[protein]-cysteine S-methyltransferase [Arthrobacter monumenti]
MRTHTSIDSPIGVLTLVNTDGVLSAVYMEEHTHMPDAGTFGDEGSAGFEDATGQLAEYFAGERRTFTLPLAPAGSGFQRKVWKLLTEIPYGETRSYGQLADQLGNRSVIRAVGAANGRNPLSIIVPCHRVVGADGSLTGYAGGLERKKFLLGLENPARVDTLALF